MPADRPSSAPTLYGRRGACEELERLLAQVRAGESRALVVRGEGGIGKTALLEHLLARAADCRVVRTAGVESEMELPFAGLQQLCAPFCAHLDRLPRPQHVALATALGLRAGPAPERFIVGLAVLNLLADVADGAPLVCVVEDAQWLDRASLQALAFVARRLHAESVAILFAERESTDRHDLRGLPALTLRGLSDADARTLLHAALSGPLDTAVRDGLVAEARGNPLALLELPRALTPAELAGGFGLLARRLPEDWVEEAFRRRLAALPDATRRLLLVAAAEPSGDPLLLWRAAARLGIGFDAADPAAAAELLDIDTRTRFRHPLVRSAVYRAATPEERRRAHVALAAVTDPQADPDRRAWHRAHAATEPDAGLAAELERAAAQAQARGGFAAAAAFLERSAALTLDPPARAARALAAAQAKHQAGAPEAAGALLAGVQTGPLDALQRAHAELLRGHIAFAAGRGRSATTVLLGAARRFEPLAPPVARAAYRDALAAALFVGRMGPGAAVRDVARAARAVPSTGGDARDRLLDGLALVVTEGHAAGAPELRGALRAIHSEDLADPDALRWMWLATHAALGLWDDRTWELLSTRHVRLARRVGALAALPIALHTRVGLHVHAGELNEAESLVQEAQAVTAAIGGGLPQYGALALAAWRGRRSEAVALFDVTLRDAAARSEGMGWTLVHTCAAVLHNGLGEHEQAYEHAAQAAAHPEELGFATLVLPELVEAAARSGREQPARAALVMLRERTQASGTDWARGLQARCDALLSGGEGAERLFRVALEHLGRTSVRTDLARTHLLYGEWLRAAGRREDARAQLRLAYDGFTAMGTEAFAARAARELRATGERLREQPRDVREELTAQEAQIARLAGAGRTNPEIGAELYLSPRTVEWHLRKVFGKLAISSRKELEGALEEPAPEAVLV